MLLDVQHISKSFPGKDVLSDVTFHLENKEKAAIVGINGAGKTTLLRILLGEEEADSGVSVLSKGVTVGYLSQHQNYDGEGSIYEAVFSSNTALLSLESRIQDTQEEIARLSGDAVSKAALQLSRMQEAYEAMDGYAYRSEVVGVLKGLGFTEEEFPRPAASLSGGQKTRLSLARILLQKPQFLILDEPTNHLDMRSVAWLENYLAGYEGAVLAVSHDRYFLNRFVTKIIEIENTHAHVYSGNYDAYSEKKAMLRKAQLTAYLNAQRKIAHEEAVIEKLRSFNREKSIKRAESREKKLAKMDTPEKPVSIDTDMRLTLTPSYESGNDVLTLEHLGKSFGDLTLFTDFDLLIKKGDRVVLIGDNGTGKSTLLKMITGLVPPSDGLIRLGAKVVIGYYDQENQLLHMEKTIFEELSDTYPGMNNTRIRSVLAAFLFTGEEVFTRIGSLSGGERARVSLAKLMLSNANFLILDEPTNHLDIYSRSILEDALVHYQGTLLSVSHDRYYINKTATRILDLTDKQITCYNGNYDYYLGEKEKQRLAAINSMQSRTSNARSEKETPGETEKERWQKKRQEDAAKRKRENDIRRAEEAISRLEDRNSEIALLLQDPAIASDPAQCLTLSEEAAENDAKLEALYEFWEALQT